MKVISIFFYLLFKAASRKRRLNDSHINGKESDKHMTKKPKADYVSIVFSV